MSRPHRVYETDSGDAGWECIAEATVWPDGTTSVTSVLIQWDDQLTIEDLYGRAEGQA
jgi:hypothetical protein